MNTIIFLGTCSALFSLSVNQGDEDCDYVVGEKKCPDGTCMDRWSKCDFDNPPVPGGISCKWELCRDGVCIENLLFGCPGDCGIGQKECPDLSCVAQLDGCPGDCGLFEKKCSDGSCVDSSDRCPGDCYHGERRCPDGKCYKYSTSCPDQGCSSYRPHICGIGSTHCYSDSDKCDGYKTCPDTGADEAYCPELKEKEHKRRTSNILLAIGIPVIIIFAICAISSRIAYNRGYRFCDGSSDSRRYDERPPVRSGPPPASRQGTAMYPVNVSHGASHATPTATYSNSGAPPGGYAFQPRGGATPSAPPQPQHSGGPPVYGQYTEYPKNVPPPATAPADETPGAEQALLPPPPSYDSVVVTGGVPSKHVP